METRQATVWKGFEYQGVTMFRMSVASMISFLKESSKEWAVLAVKICKQLPPGRGFWGLYVLISLSDNYSYHYLNTSSGISALLKGGLLAR